MKKAEVNYCCEGSQKPGCMSSEITLRISVYNCLQLPLICEVKCVFSSLLTKCFLEKQRECDLKVGRELSLCFYVISLQVFRLFVLSPVFLVGVVETFFPYTNPPTSSVGAINCSYLLSQGSTVRRRSATKLFSAAGDNSRFISCNNAKGPQPWTLH